jgi:hypothetical protein
MPESPDHNIEAIALLVIHQEGDRAGPYAASRVVELEKKGEHAEALRWLKILGIIHRLQDLQAANSTRH